jgi:hypothetical protein
MKKIEEEYWQGDGLMDEIIDRMIIQLVESSNYTSTDGFWSSSEQG